MGDRVLRGRPNNSEKPRGQQELVRYWRHSPLCGTREAKSKHLDPGYPRTWESGETDSEGINRHWRERVPYRPPDVHRLRDWAGPMSSQAVLDFSAAAAHHLGRSHIQVQSTLDSILGEAQENDSFVCPDREAEAQRQKSRGDAFSPPPSHLHRQSSGTSPAIRKCRLVLPPRFVVYWTYRSTRHEPRSRSPLDLHILAPTTDSFFFVSPTIILQSSRIIIGPRHRCRLYLSVSPCALPLSLFPGLAFAPMQHG
ncbi:hypothetical protein HYQ46_009183 [Verticillium longisporum]|nr:hypothetical protein HYQ46_009183 [Verticillium longisporum]